MHLVFDVVLMIIQPIHSPRESGIFIKRNIVNVKKDAYIFTPSSPSI